MAREHGGEFGRNLAALVPPTQMEDDMLGDARDRSVDSAMSEAASKYRKVRESVRLE
ncbi:hypothetical protein [Halomonas sp. DQ26W]|uniref:hypothetical protein n=1 Tax=Halomonas sp. DQ26W TaxID=2282311 RepID=UPI002162F025|nr:hypothetical protein [Halomonas sp. DQ26W]